MACYKEEIAKRVELREEESTIRCCRWKLLLIGLASPVEVLHTLAMLPRELGGIVGPDLKVYGIANLRVVDSSIIPVIPSAHLQSVVYALAEKVSSCFQTRTSVLY